MPKARSHDSYSSPFCAAGAQPERSRSLARQLERQAEMRQGQHIPRSADNPRPCRLYAIRENPYIIRSLIELEKRDKPMFPFCLYVGLAPYPASACCVAGSHSPSTLSYNRNRDSSLSARLPHACCTPCPPRWKWGKKTKNKKKKIAGNQLRWKWNGTDPRFWDGRQAHGDAS